MKTVTSHRGQPLRLNIQFCLEFSHPLHKVGSFTGEGTDSVHGLRSHSSLWTELVFEPHPQLLLQGEWEITPPGSGWGEDPGRHFQETLPVVTEALCHDRNKLSPMWPLAPWARALELLAGWPTQANTLTKPGNAPTPHPHPQWFGGWSWGPCFTFRPQAPPCLMETE